MAGYGSGASLRRQVGAVGRATVIIWDMFLCGSATFDAKTNALAKFTKSVTENRGRATDDVKEAFFAAGYTEANLIDFIIVIGNKLNVFIFLCHFINTQPFLLILQLIIFAPVIIINSPFKPKH